jgi:ABC-type polysaccharide/polyol phosphate export permease
MTTNSSSSPPLTDPATRILPWWKTLGRMALHDLQARYAGAALGLIWSIAQPLVMGVILWIVIGYGMRTSRIGGLPGLAWILPGMAAWSFFAEALNTATQALQEYAFLVKKVRFRVILLPPVKIISSLAVHLIFLALTMVVTTMQGVTLSWNLLWLPYYMVGLLALLTGLSWITASLHALARDIGHIVSILLQFGFWLTPVFWSPEMLPEGILRRLICLNPMYYIVDGYRRCLVFSTGPDWGMPAIVFWLETAIILWIGAWMFNRLSGYFADTL